MFYFWLLFLLLFGWLVGYFLSLYCFVFRNRFSRRYPGTHFVDQDVFVVFLEQLLRVLLPAIMSTITHQLWCLKGENAEPEMNAATDGVDSECH